MKRHFATWKYFVKKGIPVAGKDKAQEGTKQKFYISSDCNRVEDDEGKKVAKEEAKIKYRELMHNIQQVGVNSTDKLSLEYWGLPKGLVDSIV